MAEPKTLSAGGQEALRATLDAHPEYRQTDEATGEHYFLVHTGETALPDDLLDAVSGGTDIEQSTQDYYSKLLHQMNTSTVCRRCGGHLVQQGSMGYRCEKCGDTFTRIAADPEPGTSEYYYRLYSYLSRML